MSLIGWTGTELPGCFMFQNEVIPEYEIKKVGDDKFYVVRTVEECDDVGPLKSFAEAEAAVMMIGRMLMGAEEAIWLHVAAMTLKNAGLISLQSEQSVEQFMQGVLTLPESDLGAALAKAGMPNKHDAFLRWAGENYDGLDYEQLLDWQVQSGAYPEDFEEEYLK